MRRVGAGAEAAGVAEVAEVEAEAVAAEAVGVPEVAVVEEEAVAAGRRLGRVGWGRSAGAEAAEVAGVVEVAEVAVAAGLEVTEAAVEGAAGVVVVGGVVASSWRCSLSLLASLA